MKYTLEYNQYEFTWEVVELEDGFVICSDSCKQVAVFLKDALEEFDKTLGEYL